ncbi:MAG: L,D-transpeptidase family protein [Gammaproteobacteria bacterium]|nr:L,D-transpeptidase family protein [Gammaproteobacteria bacterium]
MLLGKAHAATSTVENIRLLTKEWLTEQTPFSQQIDSLHVPNTLKQLYQQRHYQPIWFDQTGLKPEAKELLVALSIADEEGLSQHDYHRLGIQWRSFSGKNKPRLQAEQELLLSDAFFGLANHLYSGIFTATESDGNWHIDAPKFDAQALLTALQQGHSIKELLRALTPPHPGYRALRSSLARYRRIESAGGWPPIARGSAIRLGAKDPRLNNLRDRLLISGDLTLSAEINNNVYDKTLQQAVKNFQQRMGLEPDGKLGPQTLHALNTPVSKRIEHIQLNMVRWHWLPRELGKKHIFVNTVSFELDLIDNYRPALNMKAIVGKTYRSTPAFSEKLTHFVLNPSWYIPANILRKDILPEVKKNRDYLQWKNIHVQKVKGDKVEEIPLEKVEWTEFFSNKSPYRLRQSPGKHNALGQVKFYMPNPYGIYLHDTPSRKLFQKTVRTFSSGCIRLEHPLALAAYLLKDEAQWNQAKLHKAVSQKQTRWVKLSNPISVYLTYFTSWVDGSGQAHFRQDMYKRDRKLQQKLFGQTLQMARF